MAGTVTQQQGPFVVGEWIAEPDSLTIRRGADERALEPRAFGVLAYLAGRSGRVVTIDELMDALWAGAVVTPNAVTRVIAQLRKALDDDARQPRYIQTVTRTGYRLIAEIGEPPATVRRRRLPLVVGAALAAATVLAVATAWWFDAPREPSIAVLPFENYTGDESLDYLGYGVAEEVINSLAQMPALQVASRTRSFAVHENTADLEKTAAELDVAYVVEGSVRRSGETLRITAQLIAADTGVHVWSHTAEHGLLDLFDAQDAISGGVADAMSEEIGVEAVARRRSRVDAPDPEAYDLYLRGRDVWHRRSTTPLQPAIDAFSEAVRIDPDFARGWAALASAYVTYPSQSPKGYATWHLAEEAAAKARELDPDIPETYGILGTFAQVRHEWVEADALFHEGVRRDEKNATARYWLSEHYAKTGSTTASAEQLRIVRTVDPLYAAPQIDTAFMYLMFGQYRAGADRFRDLWKEGVQNSASFAGNFIGGLVAGDFERVRGLIDLAPFPDPQKALLHEFVDVEAGQGDRQAVVDGLFGADPARLPHELRIWAGSRLEAYDAVFDMIDAHLDENRYLETRVLWGPATQLREQPRFLELLARLRLIEFWDTVGWGDICRKLEDRIACDAEALTPDALERVMAAES